MTVLEQYQRLEAEGVWRPRADAQRQDVIASIGEATLTLSTATGAVLTHWSLPAMRRLNPGAEPALFTPDGEESETLEIADTEMIEALTRVMRAVHQGQAQPGRVRSVAVLGLMAAFALLLFVWLPGAMARYVAGIVPDAVRTDVSERLFAEVRRVTGGPCASPSGVRALGLLAERLWQGQDGARLAVMPSALTETAHLPKGIILIGRAVVEDHETPEALAGYVLAEDLRRRADDPFERFLREAGLVTTLRLLTTGEISERKLRRHAERVVSAPPAPLPDEALIATMERMQVPTAPYAYARDISGETTIRLIEASQTIRATDPLLDDGHWLALQSICDS